MPSNPWDIPPFPAQGDEDEDTTYAAVGRAISYWESIEVSLSYLYSAFVGKPAQLGALREYGNGRIFAERMKGLKTAADGFFRRYPNQANEGRFDRLARSVTNFATRRADIAHGIVRPFQWDVPPGHARIQWCLVPPHYDQRRFDHANRPTYAYASREILQFAGQFHILNQEAENVRVLVFAALPK
jgi:hypothetical protein